MKTTASKRKPRKINGIIDWGNPPAFKAGEMPHLSANASQCGQRAYLRREDADQIGAATCAKCGLFHVKAKEVAA